MSKLNIEKGINFKCQGSANCCISRGSYGFVYLSRKDIKRLSKHKNIDTKKFISKYCQKTNGFLHLKEKQKNGHCLFLDKKKCTVYIARPTQCRTWPFWKENMNVKIWNEEVLKFCPGVGMGKIINRNKIKKNIRIDDQNEKNILKEV